MPDTYAIVDPGDAHRPETAEVIGFLPEAGRVKIDCYGPRPRFGELQPATVNWPAIGAVSPADAVAFAALLVEAAEVAGRLLPAGAHTGGA